MYSVFAPTFLAGPPHPDGVPTGHPEEQRCPVLVRLYAVLLGCALVAVPGVATATSATAAASSVALVGDLQSELGCSADWQPECAATELSAGR